MNWLLLVSIWTHALHIVCAYVTVVLGFATHSIISGTDSNAEDCLEDDHYDSLSHCSDFEEFLAKYSNYITWLLSYHAFEKCEVLILLYDIYYLEFWNTQKLLFGHLRTHMLLSNFLRIYDSVYLFIYDDLLMGAVLKKFLKVYLPLYNK